jgi:hypothetical protein
MALPGGQDPAGAASPATKVVPVASIGRVEVSHGRDTVKFHTVEAGKPAVVDFTVAGQGAPKIARAVVERAGITHPERSEDVGVVEALLGPVILGAIAGVLWALVYAAATGDEEIDTTRGGRLGRGLKVIVAFLASLLGPNGTLVVGAILLVAFLGWAVRRIVKRPQRLVWGPATA